MNYIRLELKDLPPLEFDYNSIYSILLSDQNLRLPGLAFDEARVYFSDGRVSGLLMERMVATIFSQTFRSADSKRSTFDFTDKFLNTLVECKVVTLNGVDPRPSNMKGQGRKHNHKEYLKQLAQLSHFIFVDVAMLGDLTQLPEIKIIPVPVEHGILWKGESPVRKISRKKFDSEFNCML